MTTSSLRPHLVPTRPGRGRYLPRPLVPLVYKGRGTRARWVHPDSTRSKTARPSSLVLVDCLVATDSIRFVSEWMMAGG